MVAQRNYFQILEDTLLGFTLEPWRRRQKRRLVETAKFYLFDVGVGISFFQTVDGRLNGRGLILRVLIVDRTLMYCL